MPEIVIQFIELSEISTTSKLIGLARASCGSQIMRSEMEKCHKGLGNRVGLHSIKS